MFKLVVLFAVIAVAAAKPGFLAAVPAVETRTAVIGETTVESHGNAVVHAAAPVTTSISSPALIESRAILPAVAPVVHSAPFITYPAPAPVFASYRYGPQYF
ncbi:uncharacterized protein LOC131666211 [Phymastichus coffea]|uniref:uncharacterized protein LOC131666211 n=1 Tax=Phymastichus coffea TaxID=108790 RepID=UPI00273C4C21|nr:uncharacterized protein LOC131666211 [Phymastichus coffea]